MYLLSTYRAFLRLCLKLLVKSKSIPDKPIEDLDLSLDQFFIYILPYRSQLDLLILDQQCKKYNLPSPLEKNVIDGEEITRYVFLEDGINKKSLFKNKSNKVSEKTKKLTAVFDRYIAKINENAEIDVQVIPASVLWGRAPGYEKDKQPPKLRLLSGFRKALTMLWFGRDNFVNFSKATSLRFMNNRYVHDDNTAAKLIRMAHIHFARQKISATGPKLLERNIMFSQILSTNSIKELIVDEARVKKITEAKARKNAEKILDEIAANFSYESLRVADRFLSWLWNKLYQGIEIKNSARVRELALDGHGIIYLPCHRSHMDYLLLSYLLYHQGLVPPHIAAGINLNFWPAGPLFRRGGAFFIRRSLKGNRFYAVLFREYLAQLFRRGYAVEFFIEGGRSRTGRLLSPKTGMMSMTVQAFEQGLDRPISIVPVYVGYEHVLEVGTYAKELKGAAKEKENAALVLRVIKKLRNLGKSYVVFGEPININNYISQNYPNWREDEDKKQIHSKIVNDISRQTMVNINSAAAFNAINLIGSILLSTKQRVLSKEQLLEQLEFYIEFFKGAAYSDDISIVSDRPEEMLERALNLQQAGIVAEKDSFGELIRLKRDFAILMTYYRNNVQHLFVIPALISAILLHYEAMEKSLLFKIIQKFYPFLESELFLRFNKEQDLKLYFEKIITSLANLDILDEHDGLLRMKRQKIHLIPFLSEGVQEVLQRYFITLSLLKINQDLSRADLEQQSQKVAQRLSVLHGINAPEFFDKSVFSGFVKTLRQMGYFDEKLGKYINIDSILLYLRPLINSEVRQSIEMAIEKEQRLINAKLAKENELAKEDKKDAVAEK